MKILKFYADWCVPCKSLSKLIDGVDMKYPVVEVNIDNDIELVDKYSIRGIPTLILLDHDNNVVKTKSGSITKKDLLEFTQ